MSPSPSAGVANLVNKRNVVVGQGALFLATAHTPPPADSATPFDPAVYLVTVIGVGAASAGSVTVTLTGGPFDVPVTASLPFGSIASAAAALIQAVLPVGYTAVVIGTFSSGFKVYVVGPGSSNIIVTAVAVGLTGGTLLVIPPVFTPAGATEQGWSVNYNPSVQDINIEEQQTPVGQEITSAQFQYTAVLSEDTVTQLGWALGTTSTVQAPGAGVYGKTTLALQGDLPTYAGVLETFNKFKLPRRIYASEMTCAANVTMAFRRAAGQRMIPVTFTTICPVEEIIIEEITAVPTS